MTKPKIKLTFAIFFITLFAAGVLSLVAQYQKNKQGGIQPPVSTVKNGSEVSEDILKLIGPPPGFDASKPVETDPEILKLIGPPPGFEFTTSTGEIDPEILKLIGPPPTDK